MKPQLSYQVQCWFSIKKKKKVNLPYFFFTVNIVSLQWLSLFPWLIERFIPFFSSTNLNYSNYYTCYFCNYVIQVTSASKFMNQLLYSTRFLSCGTILNLELQVCFFSFLNIYYKNNKKKKTLNFYCNELMLSYTVVNLLCFSFSSVLPF